MLYGNTCIAHTFSRNSWDTEQGIYMWEVFVLIFSFDELYLHLCACILISVFFNRIIIFNFEKFRFWHFPHCLIWCSVNRSNNLTSERKTLSMEKKFVSPDNLQKCSNWINLQFRAVKFIVYYVVPLISYRKNHKTLFFGS